MVNLEVVPLISMRQRDYALRFFYFSFSEIRNLTYLHCNLIAGIYADTEKRKKGDKK